MSKFLHIDDQVINTNFIESVVIENYPSKNGKSESYSVFIYTSKADYRLFSTDDLQKAHEFLDRISEKLEAVTV